MKRGVIIRNKKGMSCQTISKVYSFNSFKQSKVCLKHSVHLIYLINKNNTSTLVSTFGCFYNGLTPVNTDATDLLVIFCLPENVKNIKLRKINNHSNGELNVKFIRSNFFSS